jgi:hypothetical protein
MSTAFRNTATAAKNRSLPLTIGLALLSIFTHRQKLHGVDSLDDRLLRDIGITRADIEAMRRHW